MFDLNKIHIPGATGILEIIVLAIAFYYVMRFFYGTRGAQVLSGFVISLLFMMVITQIFHLAALNWVLRKAMVYLVLAFVVIFQPEIRRALAQLGKQSVFTSAQHERGLVDHIVKAVELLSERKIGALIAVEREIGTRALQESGTRIDGRITPELLASIFFPNTPLHDGGVIIQRGRIVAAGCLFPLSQRSELSKSLGTRHRAAIGLTEEIDAIVVVVSEETGSISVAYHGRLMRGLEIERLYRMLDAVLVRGKRVKSTLSRVKDELDLTLEGMARTEEYEAEAKE